MTFTAIHKVFDSKLVFTKNTAPAWLTSKNTVRGSTMDDRWFWEDHVMKLDVGQSTETDFHTITRIS